MLRSYKAIIEDGKIKWLGSEPEISVFPRNSNFLKSLSGKDLKHILNSSYRLGVESHG